MRGPQVEEEAQELLVIIPVVILREVVVMVFPLQLQAQV
jgi:hypothetical protein